ncbi:MAG: prenyltransferase/squalene oxidase repeat-containing protein [Pirellulales bacterium]
MKDPERAAAEFITPEIETAIKQGLKYLASRQNESGSFGTLGVPGFSGSVAIGALAGMAFMASGSTPNRGPYGGNVAKCVEFILDNCQASGFIGTQGDDSRGPMYGHGFATLFLAESYGMTMRPEIRDKLAKAVHLIVNTQNSEGAWRYQPIRDDGDISVTVCEVMALRAARNAGLAVPHDTIQRAVDYVKRCQNTDGGFMYILQQPGPSQFPRSAAAVVALYSAGIYEGPEIQKGLDYLMESIPRGEVRNRENYYYYGHYYAIQAMWHAGGKYWSRWYPAIAKALLERLIVDRQRELGYWEDPTYSREYGTAMALIVLQMPNNYLPIFQR